MLDRCSRVTNQPGLGVAARMRSHAMPGSGNVDRGDIRMIGSLYQRTSVRCHVEHMSSAAPTAVVHASRWRSRSEDYRSGSFARGLGPPSAEMRPMTKGMIV
jgi:hypothetical protein